MMAVVGKRVHWWERSGLLVGVWWGWGHCPEQGSSVIKGHQWGDIVGPGASQGLVQEPGELTPGAEAPKAAPFLRG